MLINNYNIKRPFEKALEARKLWLNRSMFPDRDDQEYLARSYILHAIENGVKGYAKFAGFEYGIEAPKLKIYYLNHLVLEAFFARCSKIESLLVYDYSTNGKKYTEALANPNAIQGAIAFCGNFFSCHIGMLDDFESDR